MLKIKMNSESVFSKLFMSDYFLISIIRFPHIYLLKEETRLMSTEQAIQEIQLAIRKIGGIDETSVSFSPAVAGEMRQTRPPCCRRLWLLWAAIISRWMGTDNASVELEIDEETYQLEFIRQKDTVVSNGDPYLENPTLADLFTFLIESNEARWAVANNDDLRDFIIRPIDADEIQEKNRPTTTETKRDRTGTRGGRLPQGLASSAWRGANSLAERNRGHEIRVCRERSCPPMSYGSGRCAS